LKFFEAAAVGTLTVATPIFSYRNAIRDGAISWLSTEDQWREKLQKAIEIGSDYADMAERAREYALEIYSPEIQLTAIRQALDV
jgi:glycosyltransferase involved in cell wall biosynthesis